ncbi:hypothetical protein LHYA1_G009137, partial [Lachnellula hyalina]
MSTTWLESYSFPRIFKGRRERTGPDKGVGLYQPLNPSSGQTDFRRTLPRAPAVVSAFSYVAVENPNPGAGILTGFPFEGRRTSAHFKTEFPYLLGSTNPCPTAFSFEYLLLPPRSALGAVLPGITPKASSLTPTPAYSPGHRFYPGGEFIRQVSCYTFLSGFRLPWPPSCCLDELTPFVVSDERIFRHLNFTFGSSRIASSAYQKWPTSSFAPIPKFDDRFARQNRCEPPPEFPLASPYLGIVHHLSGPNSYALTQIHPKTSGSVDDAPLRVLTSVHFHYAYGLLGPCFKTGRLQPLRQHPSRSAVLGPGRRHCTEGYNTPRKKLHSQGLYPTTQTDAGPKTAECTQENLR